MLDIAKAILDAAKAILGLADQLKTAERQQRADMADLFDKISACLAATSSEIRAGEIPHGRCGELMMYADSLPPLAMGALGDEKAKALVVQLHSAYAVAWIRPIASSTSRKYGGWPPPAHALAAR